MSKLDHPSQIKQLEGKLKNILANAKIKATPLPEVPELKLYLLSPDEYKGPIPTEEAQAVAETPPYWIFCWASGQALAHYIINKPETVRGKNIVDFGSGSGVVAIAAAMAGAKQVFACDNDPDAQQAILANAELNGIALNIVSNLFDLPSKVDLLTAADVLYDQENFPLLDQFTHCASEIIIADSRVKNMPSSLYREFERYTTSTVPDLDEHADFRDVKLYTYHNTDT